MNPDTAYPVPDPAARLMAAADHLRTLLAAIATESPADLPLHADGRTVTQGRVGLHDFATAATPEVAAFIVAMGPLAGEAMAALLEQTAAALPEAMHEMAEYADEGTQCVDDCGGCAAESAALQLADAILAGAEQ